MVKDGENSKEPEETRPKQDATEYRDDNPEEPGEASSTQDATFYIIYDGAQEKHSAEQMVDIILINTLSNKKRGIYTVAKENSDHGEQEGCDECREDVSWLNDILTYRLPNSRIMCFDFDPYNLIGGHVHLMMGTFQKHAMQLLENLRLRRAEIKRQLIIISHGFGSVMVKKALVLAELDPKQRYHFVIGNLRGIIFLKSSYLEPEAVIGILEQYFADDSENKTQMWEIFYAYRDDLRKLQQWFETAVELLNIENYEHKGNFKQKALLDQVLEMAANSSGPARGATIQSENSQLSTLLSGLLVSNPVDDRQRFVDARGEYYIGTCKWLASQDCYQKWLNGPGSELLVLNGGAGRGKSFIALYLTEELEKYTEELLESRTLAYYFCDAKDEKLNTPVKVLRGLMFQLLRQRPKLCDLIVSEFHEHGDRLFSSPSALHDLWKIFVKMIRNIDGITYCIIDGLDEVELSSLEVFLQYVRKLFGSFKGKPDEPIGFKLLIFSRKSPSCITNELQMFSCVDIDQMDYTKQDMDKVVDLKTKALFALQHCSESLQKDLPNALFDGADGVFLWVDIICVDFQTRGLGAMEGGDVSQKLPRNLNEFFLRILHEIFDTHSQELCLNLAKILQVITVAYRPLSLMEVSVATGLFQDKPESILDSMRETIQACNAFLRISDQLTVDFIHLAPKEFLLSSQLAKDPVAGIFSVDEEKAHFYMSKKCLDSVQKAFVNGPLRLREPKEEDLQLRREMWTQGEEQSEEACSENIGHHYKLHPGDNWRIDLWPTDKKVLKEWPLLEYSTLHWPQHLGEAGPPNDTFSLLVPFFRQPPTSGRVEELDCDGDARDVNSPSACPTESCSMTPTNLRQWWESYWHATQDEEDNEPDFFSLLHVAAYFCLTNVVNEMRVYNTLVPRYATLPIFRVSLFKRVCRSLGKRDGNRIGYFTHGRGIHVDAQDGAGRTALFVATRQGHQSIVHILLRKGADPNIPKYINEETPLHEATQQSNESMVELLLLNGADPNQMSTSASVLYLAAIHGHLRIIRLLLKYRADPNLQRGNSLRGTPLHGAVRRGHTGAVQLLIRKGANPNIRREADEATPLSISVEQKDIGMAQCLLQNGADPNLGLKCHGNTPLGAALEEDNIELVRVLVEEGADLNHPDKCGELALHVAVRRGNKDDIRFLLEHGADPNRSDWNGNAALHNATLSGVKDASIVRLLVDFGADPTVVDTYGRTALDKARNMGDEEFLSIFNEKGL